MSWDHPASHPIIRLPKRKRNNRAAQRFWKLTYSTSEGKSSPSEEPVLEGRKCRFALFSPQTQIEVQRAQVNFIRNEFPYPPHDCLLFFSSRQPLPAFARSHHAALFEYYAALCCAGCAAAAVFDTLLHPIPIQRKKKRGWLVIPFCGSFSSLA